MARPSKNSLPQNENAPPAPSTSAPPPRPSLVRARSSSAPPPRRVFGEATNQENPEDPDKRRSKRVRSRLAAQDHPPPPPPPRPPIRLDKNRTAARLATFTPIAAATSDTPLALRLAPPAPSLTFSEPDPRQPGRGRAVSLTQSSPALLQPLPSANNPPPPPPLRTFPCEGYAVTVPQGQSAMATMPLDVLMGRLRTCISSWREERWFSGTHDATLGRLARKGTLSLIAASLLVTWRATFDGRIDPDWRTLRKGEWTVRRLLEAYEAAADKRDEYWLQLDHLKRRIHSLSSQLQQSRLGTRHLIDAVSSARSIRIATTFKENGRKSIPQLVRSVRRLNKPSYRPKQYPKLLLDAGVLLWRAGSAELAQSFFLLFGFPSISTLRRNFHFFTFFACPGFPQLWEVLHHLDNHFRNIATENPALLALSLPWIVMNDAVHLTDRYEQCRRTGRWMGGAFWEMEGMDLTVSEASMATAGGRIEEGKLHRAKQASVYAVAPVGASKSYYGRVFLVLPVTDEKPDVSVDVQVNLFLSQILQWYFRRQNLGTVSCFNRDGHAYGRRGNYEAFSTSTLEKEASPAVFNLLAPLHLYDFSCGPGGVKYASDGKHNSKRVVTLTGRPNGINFDGISLSHKELRAFVREILPAEDERVIDDIVDHIDKMRVSGATRFNHLLSVIASDTPPPSSTFSLDYSNPLVQAKSRLAKLVGFIFGNYSNAQGDPLMDIRQRFVLLSSTAHSLYAAFLAYGTAFCQSELAHDILSSILVMFYHAAILKSLGQEEQCMYLLQEGTDRLEEIFGILRTLFRTDKNMTLSMLSERISSLSEILRIRESLKIRPKNKRRDISLEAGYDHEAPRHQGRLQGCDL